MSRTASSVGTGQKFGAPFVARLIERGWQLPAFTHSAAVGQERASGCLRNRRRHIWELESPSAKVADPDEFRCSGIPFRQGMSLRLEPHFKFIIGAEGSDDLRLQLGLCVAKRRGNIHSLR